MGVRRSRLPGSTLPGSTLPRSTLLAVLFLAALALLGPVLFAPARPAAARVRAPVPGSVPPGFRVESTTWSDSRTGWVFGWIDCGAGGGPRRDGLCPRLVSTADGGRTWTRLTPPPLGPSPIGSQVRVRRFVPAPDPDTGRVGPGIAVATDGRVLYATDDGAASWHRVDVGPVRPTYVSGIAGSADGVYAVVAAGNGGAGRAVVYRTPLTASDWSPVPGLVMRAATGQGSVASLGGDLSFHGRHGMAVLEEVGEQQHAWTTADGVGWTAVTPPCGARPTTLLAQVSDRRVRALCSFDPGRGSMKKHLLVSDDGGTHFRLAGVAPEPGITTAFAATSKDTAAVGSTGGDQAFVFTTFDGGGRWEESLAVVDCPGVEDLGFTDAVHGHLVCGLGDLGSGRLYRTADGGHDWVRLPVR